MIRSAQVLVQKSEALQHVTLFFICLHRRRKKGEKKTTTKLSDENNKTMAAGGGGGTVWVGKIYIDDIARSMEEIQCLRSLNKNFLIDQRKKILENVLTDFGRLKLLEPIDWHLENGYCFLQMSDDHCKDLVAALNRFDSSGRALGDKRRAFEDRVKAAVAKIGGYPLTPDCGKGTFVAAYPPKRSPGGGSGGQSQKPRGGNGRQFQSGGTAASQPQRNPTAAAGGNPQASASRPTTAPPAVPKQQQQQGWSSAAAAGNVGGGAQKQQQQAPPPAVAPAPEAVKPTPPPPQQTLQEDQTVAQLNLRLKETREKKETVARRMTTVSLMIKDLENKLQTSLALSESLKAQLAFAEAEQNKLRLRLSQQEQSNASSKEEMRLFDEREAQCEADLQAAQSRSKP